MPALTALRRLFWVHMQDCKEMECVVATSIPDPTRGHSLAQARLAHSAERKALNRSRPRWVSVSLPTCACDLLRAMPCSMCLRVMHVAHRGVCRMLRQGGDSLEFWTFSGTSQHIAGECVLARMCFLGVLSPFLPSLPAQAADPSKCWRLSRRGSHFFGSAAWAGRERKSGKTICLRGTEC